MIITSYQTASTNVYDSQLVNYNLKSPSIGVISSDCEFNRGIGNHSCSPDRWDNGMVSTS